MTNEQTSTAHNEAEDFATLDYLMGKLQHAFMERQRAIGRRQRISRLDALEVIHAILRYEVEHGL